MIEAAQITQKTPRIPERDYVRHKEVAERAGITQAPLSQMESGEAKLRKATRGQLAQTMGLNPGQLV